VPVAAWIGLGIALAIMHVWLSQQLMLNVLPEPVQAARTYRWWYGFGALTGVVTAVSLSSQTHVVDMALLMTTTSLMLVQAPLDAVTHRLSRIVTLVALSTVGLIIVVDRFLSDGWNVDAPAILMALSVTTLYLLLHIFSSRAIGLGDVLIAMPLSVAVGASDAANIVLWQVLATASGALHAVSLSKRHRDTSIPFGPHLLGSAWLVLVFSL
jgi:hypothetical protein